MIRVAALLCACSMVLAACYGGSRAAIVRASAPVVPVCLDGRRPDTPAYLRICPLTPAQVRAVARRVGATRLRVSASADPSEFRRGEAGRRAYVESLIGRRGWSSASLSPPPSSATADILLPAALELRGGLD